MAGLRNRFHNYFEHFDQKVKAAAKLMLPPILAATAEWILKRTNKTATPNASIKFKYGDFYLECDSAHHLPDILKALPDYGRNLADLVLALNVKVPCIIDVGANIGDTAVLLERFAPGAKILCIEGDPRFMNHLKANTRQVSGVTIAQAVLSDKTSDVSGTFFKHKGTAHVELSQTGCTLRMQTLDDLLKGYPAFAHPDVVKIDTDGFDPAILRGAKKLLGSANRPVVFYEWDPYSYGIAGENDISHADFLKGLGYDRFAIFTNRGELLLNVQQPGHEVWESLGEFSRQRHSIDGWHYDVVAFPGKRHDACDRLTARCSANANSLAAR